MQKYIQVVRVTSFIQRTRKTRVSTVLPPIPVDLSNTSVLRSHHFHCLLCFSANWGVHEAVPTLEKRASCSCTHRSFSLNLRVSGQRQLWKPKLLWRQKGSGVPGEDRGPSGVLVPSSAGGGEEGRRGVAGCVLVQGRKTCPPPNPHT